MVFFQRLKAHRNIGVILVIYLIMATAHSVTVPLTMGNDEWAHFLYVRFIADHGRLPTTLAERSNRAEAGYKADDPPLYHLLVAAVTSGIEPTRLLRPINSPQRQLADNVVYPFAFIVHTGPELFPYRGEVLLAHAARLFSILFGAALVGLTYLTSLMLFASRAQAWQAAALLAFIPSIVFHTSMVSYESLSATLHALFLLAGFRALKQPGQWRWWLALGGLAGLALTAKYSAVLLPLEIIFIVWLAWMTVRPGPDGFFLRWVLQRIFVAGLAFVGACSWWFGFMVWHFNTVAAKGWLVGILEPLIVRGAADSTAVSIAAFLFGEKDISAEAPLVPLQRNYAELTEALLDSFWAGPVNGHYFGSPWLAPLFTLAAVGLGLVGLYFAWRRAEAAAKTWLILLLFHALLITPLLAVRLFLSFDPHEVAQGRHLLMPGASALAILLVCGWDYWPQKVSRLFIAGLLLWSLIGQLAWAAVVYPPPIPVWSGPAETENPVRATLVEGMQLTDFSWRETPASALEVTLWWQALSRLPADYLIELALLDANGQPVSYTLGQPVDGRYPTRAWEPGDRLKDTYWLPLIGSLQGTYPLQLRLLDRQGQPQTEPVSLDQVTVTGPVYQTANPCRVWQRGRADQSALLAPPSRLRSTLTVISPEPPTLAALPGESGLAAPEPLAVAGNFYLFMVGPDWASRYQLSNGSRVCGEWPVELPPRSFTPPPVPQPLTANFNQQVQLLGYDLPTRRIEPGQRLPLTLYWQALAYMSEDYQIFDNLLDREQRRWGGYDRRPRDGYSTLLWTPGEVITDAFGVPVDPAAPPGIYSLDIGLYQDIDHSAQSLPLIQEGQPSGQSSVRLGPIKVGGPPPGVVIEQPQPQVKVEQTLGHQITLLGYDVADNCQLSIDNCQLTIELYWQAATTPAADYTTFVHLRDAANQNAVQQDSPPAAGQYPSSLWDAGEIIVDEITLPLAEVPPGRYTPVVGLYNFVTGERLTVSDRPANEIPLEPIQRP